MKYERAKDGPREQPAITMVITLGHTCLFTYLSPLLDLGRTEAVFRFFNVQLKAGQIGKKCVLSLVVGKNVSQP